MRINPESATINSPPFDAIEQAFEAVWNLCAHKARRDATESHELKVVLSRTLIALAADGITDARELRRRAVENLTLDPR